MGISDKMMDLFEYTDLNSYNCSVHSTVCFSIIDNEKTTRNHIVFF